MPQRMGTAAPVDPSMKIATSAANAQHPAAVPSPFDAERVERFTRAIAEGRFRIDARAVADRLLADASALVAARLRDRG